MTSPEKLAERRRDPSKRNVDNLKKRIAREPKAQEHSLIDEQIEARREADRVRKARSRNNQSQQKTVGLKTKDRNHKRAALECDNGGETSTNRVRKHRDKIKLIFLFKKAKVDRVSQSLSRPLELLSPKSKVEAQTCTSSMPLGSKDDLANSIHENPFIDFIKELGKKRDKASNCARRLALGNLVTKAKAGGSYNKMRKLDCG